MAAETHSPTAGRHESCEGHGAGLVTSSRTERWVAETVAADEPSRDDLLADKKPLGTWAEAWQRLRRRPLFWVSMVIILAVLLVTFFPGLFTSTDPKTADLSKSLEGPEASHPFGFTRQGYDVYSRTLYGARASVVIGVSVTIVITILGTIIGSVAGYVGGWLDAVLSRLTDIFFAIPLILAGIVLM